MKKRIVKGDCVIDVDFKETDSGAKVKFKARGNCKEVLGSGFNKDMITNMD